MTANRFSFEFFPPRSSVGQRRFWRAFGQLETVSPAFFSITYGALGSGQQQSLTTVAEAAAETSVPIAAHLTFEGSTRDETRAVAQQFLDAGVTRLLALRGDARDDAMRARSRGRCYNSVAEMITDLRRLHEFDFSVACYPEVHPQAVSAAQDIQELKAKCDAGASRAVTQFFFDPEDFARFRDNAVAAGIDIPLVAGVLPVRDIDRVSDFAARCGARIPDSMRRRFARADGNADARRRIAQAELESLIDRLIALGCHDFHVYTLNQPISFRQLQAQSAARVGSPQDVVAA